MYKYYVIQCNGHQLILGYSWYLFGEHTQVWGLSKLKTGNRTIGADDNSFKITSRLLK